MRDKPSRDQRRLPGARKPVIAVYDFPPNDCKLSGCQQAGGRFLLRMERMGALRGLGRARPARDLQSSGLGTTADPTPRFRGNCSASLGF